MFSVFCESSSRFATVALISRLTVAAMGFPLVISALKFPLGTPLFQSAALLQFPAVPVHVLLLCATAPTAKIPPSITTHTTPARRTHADTDFKPTLFTGLPQERRRNGLTPPNFEQCAFHPSHKDSALTKHLKVDSLSQHKRNAREILHNSQSRVLRIPGNRVATGVAISKATVRIELLCTEWPKKAICPSTFRPTAVEILRSCTTSNRIVQLWGMIR